MKLSLRSLSKRLAAPWLGALDRRFAEADERQRGELERLDERVAIELRVVDEHLLAIRRLTRRLTGSTGSVHDAIASRLDDALASGDRALIMIATPRQPLVVPDGFMADDELAFRADTTADGVWTPASRSDDATLRVVRLRPRG